MLTDNTWVKAFCRKHVGSDNHNVILALVYTAFIALSNGIIWSGIFASYLYLITNKSNEKVGYSEGVFGGFSMGWGLLGGWLADKYRRDMIIRRGGYVAVIGTASLVVLCSFELFSNQLDGDLETDTHIAGSYLFVLACTGCIITTVGESISDSSSEAIFADSIATGSRLELITRFTTLNVAMSITGQVLTIIVFVALGNKWTTNDLCIVLLGGLFFRIPGCFVSFFFNDDCSLKTESKAVTEDVGSSASKSKKFTYVPWILFAIELAWCLGSGITVKFIPLFFQSDKRDGLDVSPAVVTAVLCGRQIATLFTTLLNEKLALKMGRVQSGLLFWVLGISLWSVIVVMGFLDDYNTHMGNRILIMSCFVARSGLLSGNGAADYSISMDYVPKDRRGFFTSLSAITMASWSGTSVLGGILVDRGSYKTAFLVTLAFHVLSTSLRIPLLWLVPKEQQKISKKQQNKDSISKLRILLLGKSGTLMSAADAATVKEFLILPEEESDEKESPTKGDIEEGDSSDADEKTALIN
eukprot:TRINITY_DN16801_c0_g1_i1.p1 TRINITY_DN16801_c0_g1~~TRINITY_DN16801_c0_g1_i1.p1  ORF type:complete len:565 (+),score=107.62 TRINITY_DN16801_c0_g1_i1:117-1697(+)